MCWAPPKDTRENISVLYIQRSPHDTLFTRVCGGVGSRCSSKHGMLLELNDVVIHDPIPEVRETSLREGSTYHQGVGLAYYLTQDYDLVGDEGS